MRVLDAGLVEEIEGAGQDRVADVAVEPRHRAGFDVVHPVADHHLCAALEALEEAWDVVEVVGEVGVGHHNVHALCRRETGKVGASVTAPLLVDNPCAGALR